MKSYTDIEQSKKLAEILPLESADMYYWCGEDLRIGGHKAMDIDYDIPCWSLAALLNYLKSKNKFPDIKELGDGRFKLTTFIWDGKKSFQIFIANNLVDACYKLVLKLHECEMLCS